jgi:hypothetical protein
MSENWQGKFLGGRQPEGGAGNLPAPVGYQPAGGLEATE